MRYYISQDIEIQTYKDSDVIKIIEIDGEIDKQVVYLKKEELLLILNKVNEIEQEIRR